MAEPKPKFAPLDIARQTMAIQFGELLATYGYSRTPAQPDHVKHLVGLQQRLLDLAAATRANDPAALMQLCQGTDWLTLIEEWEAPVVKRYRFEGYRLAKRIIRNVRRPYVVPHQVVQLEHLRYMLDGALGESPVLLDDADTLIADAWDTEVRKACLVKRKVRELSPITTLVGLNSAIAGKLALGQYLGQHDREYQKGNRVRYADIPAEALAAAEAAELSLVEVTRRASRRVEPEADESELVVGPRPLHDVISVVPLADYRLLLLFGDGALKTYDVTPFLERSGTVFEPLRDPERFAEAFVANGSVAWPGDVDIDPETLYEKGIDVDSLEGLPVRTAEDGERAKELLVAHAALVGLSQVLASHVRSEAQLDDMLRDDRTEQDRLTLQGMADVRAGRTVPAAVLKAWVSGNHSLPVADLLDRFRARSLSNPPLDEDGLLPLEQAAYARFKAAHTGCLAATTVEKRPGAGIGECLFAVCPGCGKAEDITDYGSW